MQGFEDVADVGHALEDGRKEHAAEHRNCDAHQTREFHHASRNDHDNRNEQQRVDVELRRKRGLQSSRHLRVVARGVDVHAEYGVENQSNHEGRRRRGNHCRHVVEETRAGNRRREVGGIRERRELIAEVCAGDNHAGGNSGVDAETRTDAEEGNADGRRCGPRGTAGKADNRTHDAADRQEEPRGQKIQTVVNDSRDGARHNEGCDQNTDGAENQNCLHRRIQTIQHAREHIRETVPADTTDDAGNADGYNQGHMRIRIARLSDEPEQHKSHHDDNGNERLYEIGQSYLLGACLIRFHTLLFFRARHTLYLIFIHPVLRRVPPRQPESGSRP